jgi:UDP-N-acetylglucosamine 4,6-dehydratase
MTRFWITIDQGVEFVLKSFERMHGGELFVPKLPSMRVVDLVRAFDKKAKFKIVGIRPGEKLHETMCPEESARQTLRFDDHFVIVPSIRFFDESVRYDKNNIGEQGEWVEDGFEYNSRTNEVFLTVEELWALHQNL